MPRYGFSEKRQGMKYFACGNTGFNADSVEEFLRREDISKSIQLAEKFGDLWRITEFDEDPNLPNKVAHPGNSKQ